MVFTEKHQKYYYHHVKLINMNILQVKKYYQSEDRVEEQALNADHKLKSITSCFSK